MNTCRLLLLITCTLMAMAAQAQDRPARVAGVYPHLVTMNNEGECGIGAVVPWADRLWVITYAPHKPAGSSDKLYEITPTLEKVIRPESVGGTPANRMIHRESGQLILSHYFIDSERNVRVIPLKDMPGRMTANARHLTDPINKVYFATMEEGLYEVDVKTLGVRCWINDGNRGGKTFADAVSSRLPGYHGKGLYSGQGRLIYANNGENSDAARKDPVTPSGALAQWGGPGKDWQLLLREQFTEVTGPGGLYGNDNEDDPVWAMGWDHRSLLLKVLDRGKWHLYRLPKASFSYDGAHGWNTEWPRIREIGTGDDLLATMHGTFWHLPKAFTPDHSAGIAPRSNYLKVVGDFARWGDRVVLGCDDSAKSEFLNKRAFKAEHGGPMRSNSNLWFIKPEQLSELGPALGSGGVWLRDDVQAGVASDPYLLAGYDKRVLHLGHAGDTPVTIELQVDRRGDNAWQRLGEVELPANGYVPYLFSESESAQWVRLVAKNDLTKATAWFSYACDDGRTDKPAAIFDGLATGQTAGDVGGLMRSLDGGDLPLGLIALGRGSRDESFYLLNESLQLTPSGDPARLSETAKAHAPDTAGIPMKLDGNSILVEEDGKRYRLPLNPRRAEDKPFAGELGHVRRVREVATERDMVNVGGTFYELPARNAGGFAHVRPIASHPYRVHDFCSWRGLLLMTGVDPGSSNERIIKSRDGKAAVWAGVVDDLWQMGKPVGEGGPWSRTEVKANEPSDPYLMYGYDKKKLVVSSDGAATITIQLDPSGTGHWHTLAGLAVSPHASQHLDFKAGINAHWVRLISDSDAVITANFVYE